MDWGVLDWSRRDLGYDKIGLQYDEHFTVGNNYIYYVFLILFVLIAAAFIYKYCYSPRAHPQTAMET